MIQRMLRAATIRAWPILLLLLAQGCMVGPDYHRPSLPAQQGWQEAGGASSLQPEDARWWRSLNDPQLVKYIELGISQNQSLAAAQARVREARALRGVAAASLMPQLGSSAQYNRSRLSENAGIASQVPPGFIAFEQDLYQVGFDASWEMDIFGGKRREVEAATARTRSSVEDLHDVLLSVVSEIARNYVELRGAQRQLTLAEKNSAIQEQTLSLVVDRFNAQIGSELEVAQARAQLDRTRASVPPLRASTRSSAYRLGVLTGQPPASLLDELMASAPIPNPPDIVPVGLPSDLLLRRPDLRRAEESLHAATADIGVATADLYPRFFLTGSISPQATKFVDLARASSLAWSFGPSVSWPVFQGGRIRSNIAATEARRDAAVAAYRQSVLTALEDVETSLAAYAERQIERERLAESAASQARAVEMAKVRYREGVQGLLTVLDAERQLTEVENALAVSETQVLVNLIRLFKALGGGWEGSDR